MNATVTQPAERDDAELRADVALAVRRSQSLTIGTDDDYIQAGEVLRGYATIVQRIRDFFDDDIGLAHKLHKSLTTKRKVFLDQVEGEMNRLRVAIGSYSAAKERARQEAERAAQAAARQAEEERVAREAAALEAAGETQVAHEVLEQHLAAPPPVVHVPSTTPKVAGVTTVEAWSYRILNPALIPREYLMVDEKKIGQVIRNTKGTVKIPGVLAVREDQVRVRGA